MSRLDELNNQAKQQHKENMLQLAAVYNECVEFLNEIKSLKRKGAIK